MTHDIVRHPPQDAVTALLAAAQLPLADITPAHLEHFFGAWNGPVLDGIVGIEPLGSAALLRSLTVAAPDALRRTAEFSALCPSSSVLMVKHL